MFVSSSGLRQRLQELCNRKGSDVIADSAVTSVMLTRDGSFEAFFHPSLGFVREGLKERQQVLRVFGDMGLYLWKIQVSSTAELLWTICITPTDCDGP